MRGLPTPRMKIASIMRARGDYFFSGSSVTSTAKSLGRMKADISTQGARSVWGEWSIKVRLVLFDGSAVEKQTPSRHKLGCLRSLDLTISLLVPRASWSDCPSGCAARHAMKTKQKRTEKNRGRSCKPLLWQGVVIFVHLFRHRFVALVDSSSSRLYHW